MQGKPKQRSCLSQDRMVNKMDSIDQVLAAARKSRRLAMDKSVSKASGGGHYFDAAADADLSDLKNRLRQNFEMHKKSAVVGNSKEARNYWKIVQKLKSEIEQITGEKYNIEAMDAEYVEVPHRGRVPPREARDEEDLSRLSVNELSRLILERSHGASSSPNLSCRSNRLGSGISGSRTSWLRMTRILVRLRRERREMHFSLQRFLVLSAKV